jgi:hypothetical protein
VCSNWALRRPSTVTAVQELSHIFSRHDPAVTIGSIVNIIPGSITVRASGL